MVHLTACNKKFRRSGIIGFFFVSENTAGHSATPTAVILVPKTKKAWFTLNLLCTGSQMDQENAVKRQQRQREAAPYL
jgi:hypothetical protein